MRPLFREIDFFVETLQRGNNVIIQVSLSGMPNDAFLLLSPRTMLGESYAVSCQFVGPEICRNQVPLLRAWTNEIAPQLCQAWKNKYPEA